MTTSKCRTAFQLDGSHLNSQIIVVDRDKTFMPEIGIRTSPQLRCIACGHPGNTKYTGLKDVIFSAPGQWSMSQCSNEDCCLCWLNPMPHPDDLSLLYQSYYTHASNPAPAAKAKLRAFLLETYRAGTLIPLSLFGIPQARRKLHKMMLDCDKPGRLLDVGCGSGEFLYRMKQMGWIVQGLDFDANAINAAKSLYGLELLVNDLHGAKFPDASFDAITMNHVIEHVHNPIELLEECKRLLRRDGKLVLTTPNSQSLGHKLFGESWRGLEPPRHLHIFSVSSLTSLARKAGFTKVRCHTTGANADILYGASEGIRRALASGNKSNAYAEIHMARALRALAFQIKEAMLLPKNSKAGEELVLIANNS